MVSRSAAVCFVVVCLLVAPARSQAPKVSFDGRAAFDYVKALSSDTMLGRKTGEPGGRMGADYVVSKFKEWGLEPAGTNGTHFQDMTVEYYEPARGAAFGIVAQVSRADGHDVLGVAHGTGHDSERMFVRPNARETGAGEPGRRTEPG